MSIKEMLQRIKNLIRWSNLDPDTLNFYTAGSTDFKNESKILHVPNKKKMAIIIPLVDPIEEIDLS